MASPTTHLPSPPFIDIPGIPNFRDAGGYPVAPSPSSASDRPKMVRRGILFRASEPSQVTPAGIAAMTDELGIRTVFDLRSQTEIDSDTRRGIRQVTEWAGAARVFAPVFAAEDYSPVAIAKRYSSFASEGSDGFVQVYERILLAGASAPAAPFARVLRHLASTTTSGSSSSSSPPAPILVHCTAGKDRTGVLVALVLALCGVADAAVAHEYSLTELGLAGARRREFVAQLVAAGPLRGDAAAASRMVAARRESMAATLRALRARWGGAEAFVRDHIGLAAAEVAALRRNMVIELREGEAPLPWEEHAQLVL